MPRWASCRTHLDLGSQVPKIVSQADDLIANGTESIASIFDVNVDAGRVVVVGGVVYHKSWGRSHGSCWQLSH
jgi:hypothetical protein